VKIVTWNVNGLRAALKKDALNTVLSWTPDLLCLQEIKARPEQLTNEQQNIPGYQIIWNPAERPGYSGVATLMREEALEVELGMDAPQFDVEGASSAPASRTSCSTTFTFPTVSAARTA